MESAPAVSPGRRPLVATRTLLAGFASSRLGRGVGDVMARLQRGLAGRILLGALPNLQRLGMVPDGTGLSQARRQLRLGAFHRLFTAISGGDKSCKN